MTAARSKTEKFSNGLPKRLLDKHAMARLLGLSAETIRRMVARGDLPGKKVAGQLRFDPREIQAWLDEQAAFEDDE